MLDEIPKRMLYLLEECVLAEERKKGGYPYWVAVQDWHDLIAHRLGIPLSHIKQVGYQLITDKKIQLHDSGRLIRPIHNFNFQR